MSFLLTDFLHYTVFVSLTVTALIILYIGKISNLSKQGSISTFILSLGIVLISFAHLLRGDTETLLPRSVTSTSFAGSILTLFGTVILSYEVYKKNRLIMKYNEIKAIISNLKEKYYKQEISEEDLKQSHADLLRELAGLEVKLERNESRKF